MKTIKVDELKDAIQEEISKQDKILEAYVANLDAEPENSNDIIKDIKEIEGEIYGYQQVLKLIDRIQKGK